MTDMPVKNNSGVSESAASRTLNLLKDKIRILEQKRIEDRQRLKVLEQTESEKQTLQTLSIKLQQRLSFLQRELHSKKTELDGCRNTVSKLHDADEERAQALELATVEREMAEEQCDNLKSRLSVIEERLRKYEENAASSGGSENMKTPGNVPFDIRSMQQENAMLREALVSLREITHTKELEMQESIRSISNENSTLSGFMDQHEGLVSELQAANSVIKELRYQLDAASKAEELIQDLTEKNLALSDDIVRLNATVTDLEALEEVNKEIEKGHQQMETEMQAEIDSHLERLGQQNQRYLQLEKSNRDLAYHVASYRDLAEALKK